MAGFEITVLSHYGSVAGLHMIQMLSSGTISYAIDTQNNGYGQGVCTSGPASVYGRSSSTHQPTAQISWDHVEVVSSSLSGTSEGALCAAVPVDADSNTAPTATWYPYIGQDGTYEIHFFTPACAFDATCGQRGAVDVEVVISGTSGSTTTTTTVNQEVDNDINTLIYSGSINPISDNSEVRVNMRLSSSERPILAAGKGDKYYLVADKVIVVAKNTDGNGSNQIKIGTGMNSVNVSTADIRQRLLDYTIGYGLFEWKISDTNTISPTLDSSITTPQQIRTLTSASTFDRSAFSFSQNAKIEHMLALPNSAGFVLAGDFEAATPSGVVQNVLFLNTDGSLDEQSTQRGLNGPVTSLALDGAYLYVAGNFSATVDDTLSNLYGCARRSVGAGNWEAISGLDKSTEASYIAQVPGEKLVISYPSKAADFWYPGNTSLVSGNEPLMIGTFSSSILASEGEVAYLAGSLSAFVQSSSSGSARITKDGLEPINFGFQTASVSSSSARSSTPSPARRSLVSSNIMSSLRNRLRKRQSGNALPVPSALPANTLVSTTEPVIVAGAHWRNTSSDADVTILGGRFVSQDGTVTNLGVLRSDGSLTPLHGANGATGDIKTLLVTDDLLWIGRADSESGALSVYDLDSQSWRTSDYLPTNAVSGSDTVPSVNTIITTDEAVIVAGYFDSINNIAGCAGICEWQKESKQWVAYGSGVEGIVSAPALSKVSLG